jgi:hypothetical protein
LSLIQSPISKEIFFNTQFLQIKRDMKACFSQNNRHDSRKSTAEFAELEPAERQVCCVGAKGSGGMDSFSAKTKFSSPSSGHPLHPSVLLDTIQTRQEIG